MAFMASSRIERSSALVQGAASMPEAKPARLRAWRPIITFSRAVICLESLIAWKVREMPRRATR